MNTGIFGKLLLGGIVSVLALGAIAFAAAESAGDHPDAQDEVSLDEPTDTPEPTEAADDEGDEADDVEDEEGDSEVARTSALNPAGHCVELPDTSDVIEDQEEHDNWTVTECDPANDHDEADTEEAEADEEEGDEDEGVERTPAANPDNHCIEIPVNSDVAEHPNDHPEWDVGDCEESGD